MKSGQSLLNCLPGSGLGLSLRPLLIAFGTVPVPFRDFRQRRVEAEEVPGRVATVAQDRHVVLVCNQRIMSY